eukprot:gene20588-7541_t
MVKATCRVCNGEDDLYFVPTLPEVVQVLIPTNEERQKAMYPTTAAQRREPS